MSKNLKSQTFLQHKQVYGFLADTFPNEPHLYTAVTKTNNKLKKRNNTYSAESSVALSTKEPSNIPGGSYFIYFLHQLSLSTLLFMILIFKLVYFLVSRNLLFNQKKKNYKY